MSHLRRFCRKRIVVEGDCRIGIIAQIELIKPAELETRLADGVIAVDCVRMMFGDIGRVTCDFVRDYALFYVIFIRKSQMLFRRYIAKHCRAVTRDFHASDSRSDVVVSGGRIGCKRSESVERSVVA